MDDVNRSSTKTEENWRKRSLWLELEPDLVARPALAGSLDCDVVIVGAGLTGLWTAYYLKRLDPNLDVCLVEREIAGFGPSGRNGGWVSSGIAGSFKAYGLSAASPAARKAEEETRRTVDEIAEVVAEEGIDCSFLKAGMLTVATTPPQARRLEGIVATARSAGLGAEDLRHLTPQEAAEFVAVPGLLAATHNPHAARVNPARLTRGLAQACERMGVVLFEQTEALHISEGSVRCATGTVTARTVVRATESYTVQAPSHPRSFLPLYSLMVATDVLGPDIWRETPWRDGLLIRDLRHLFFYAQRTADGRVAMGGRGAPYRFGSPISAGSEQNENVRDRLITAMHRHFPATEGAEVRHHWGGPLAVPRDWSMGVRFDPSTGLASAGGYSGHGVVASNISGRTLAHLILGKPSHLAEMPWVGHRARNWEPEPLRYLASQAIVRVLARADRREDRTGDDSRLVSLVRPFLPPA